MGYKPIGLGAAYNRHTMNEDTKQFVENDKFDQLYQELSTNHSQIKPKWQTQILREIGRIIVQFQRTEMTIHSFTGIFLDISNKQDLLNIVVNKLSFSNSVWVLVNVAAAKNFYRLDDLKLVASAAYKAEVVRNQIVHSVWASDSRTKKTGGKHGVQHNFEQYNADDLTRIADQINRVDDAFSALQFDYIEWCHENGRSVPGVRLIE